jgi:ribosomal protein L11 methyltransferase
MTTGGLQATTVARLSTDEPTACRLANVLGDIFGAGDGVVAAFETGGGAWAVEICFEQPPDEGAVRDLIAQAAGDAPARQFAFTTVAPEDWVAASLAGLKPVAAGRFLVYGAHDRARVPPQSIGIEIEAALAFGTGHHGTTRGCLLALDLLLKRHATARAGVLDVGTGTGVLAIAAAKAWRRRVVASDIDRRAVEVARENARSNRVGGLVRVVHAAGLGARAVRTGAPYRLILANILLPPLKRMAAPMARLVAPGGDVILSGLLDSHAAAAISAYRAQGLVLVERRSLEGWTTLVLSRRSHRPGRCRPKR